MTDWNYRCDRECGVPDCEWCDTADYNAQRARWRQEGWL